MTVVIDLVATKTLFWGVGGSVDEIIVFSNKSRLIWVFN